MTSFKIINNEIIVINHSFMNNNSYLIHNDHVAVIIDPSFNAIKLLNYLNDNKLILKAIILTHAHFDHVFDCAKILNKFNCKVYLHKNDLLTLEKYNLCEWINNKIVDFHKQLNFISNSNLIIDKFNFEIYLVPGHTTGSILIKYNEFLFTGDCLFATCCGRYDLPNSNQTDMKKSLKFIFNNFDQNTIILPGHGGTCKLKEAKLHFINRININ